MAVRSSPCLSVEQEALNIDVYQKRGGIWVYVSACATALGA
jgi:hypothetical protein